MINQQWLGLGCELYICTCELLTDFVFSYSCFISAIPEFVKAHNVRIFWDLYRVETGFNFWITVIFSILYIFLIAWCDNVVASTIRFSILVIASCLLTSSRSDTLRILKFWQLFLMHMSKPQEEFVRYLYSRYVTMIWESELNRVRVPTLEAERSIIV